MDVTVYLIVVKANIFKDSSTSEWFNIVFSIYLFYLFIKKNKIIIIMNRQRAPEATESCLWGASKIHSWMLDKSDAIFNCFISALVGMLAFWISRR